MTEKQKIPLSFYRTPSGVEPVREFIKRLPTEDRKVLGSDMLAAQ
jgi:hypothetical protein